MNRFVHRPSCLFFVHLHVRLTKPPQIAGLLGCGRVAPAGSRNVRPHSDLRRLAQVSCGWPRAGRALHLRARTSGIRGCGRGRLCRLRAARHRRDAPARRPAPPGALRPRLRAGRIPVRTPRDVLKIGHDESPGGNSTAFVLKIGHSECPGGGLRTPERAREPWPSYRIRRNRRSEGGIVFEACRTGRFGAGSRRFDAETGPPKNSLWPIFSTSTPFRLPEDTLCPIFSTFCASGSGPGRRAAAGGCILARCGPRLRARARARPKLALAGGWNHGKRASVVEARLRWRQIPPIGRESPPAGARRSARVRPEAIRAKPAPIAAGRVADAAPGMTVDAYQTGCAAAAAGVRNQWDPSTPAASPPALRTTRPAGPMSVPAHRPLTVAFPQAASREPSPRRHSRHPKTRPHSAGTRVPPLARAPSQKARKSRPILAKSGTFPEIPAPFRP